MHCSQRVMAHTSEIHIARYVGCVIVSSGAWPLLEQQPVDTAGGAHIAKLISYWACLVIDCHPYCCCCCCWCDCPYCVQLQPYRYTILLHVITSLVYHLSDCARLLNNIDIIHSANLFYCSNNHDSVLCQRGICYGRSVRHTGVLCIADTSLNVLNHLLAVSLNTDDVSSIRDFGTIYGYISKTINGGVIIEH